MELSHLRYFVGVAETGSFRAGARLAHVSPPAMTKTIQKLEAEVGAPLFRRTTRRVILTEEGKAVLRRAREALGQVDEIARDLDELKDTASGDLRIGAMEVFSIRVLPRAVCRLVAQFPKVVPRAYEMHPDAIQRHLAEGLLDVGLTIGGEATREVGCESLGTSPARVVCGRSHPLYATARITRAGLSRYPFVAPSFFGREHLPSLDQFPERTIHRSVGATIELLQMMVELVVAGSYLGCFPEISIRHHIANGDLRAVQGLAGLPRFDLCTLTRTGVAQKRAATQLIREIREELG